MSERPVLLVLDDEPSIAELIGVISARANFDAHITTSSDPFKSALQLYKPSVLVLDLQMPGMDGIEMLRFLADQKAEAGILLVSGMDARTVASAEQYGLSRGLNILGTLRKPFSPDELESILSVAQQKTRQLTHEDLRTAISEDQLLVYYQPTLKRHADGFWDVATMEALLRWNHPLRGILTPDQFIDMGEKHGLSRDMADFVIQKGIEQLKGWEALRLRLGLRINISASLIADIDFPDRLEATLKQHEIDPSLLTLEITETGMLDQLPKTFDILTRLRVKKINLAIDDFGIGYSSLTQLFRMPFNEMKIDKSLMMRVPQSREAGIMVEALIDLAHKLDLTVCSEGVETPEALEFLDRYRCDSAQGFHISRPIEARKVPEFLRTWDQRQPGTPEFARNAASLAI
jgi:EAL domain-containing protein (putative c-di-GMP-specific phosphodiesterase class I)